MNRLIVVSNRLPFALDSTAEDLWTVTPATGGLVSAVEPVLRERGGTWIGWPGTAGKIPNKPLTEATRNAGYKVVPVALTETERDEFYYGYSNEVIWPLFHDLQNFCNFRAGILGGLQGKLTSVTQRPSAGCAQPDDFIWVHDYHLMYVAQALREQGVSGKLSALTFFLHIPFPPYDIFSKLPQQQRLLHALLQFDLLGFQTRRDVRNFMQCVRRVMLDAKIVPRRDLQLIRFEKRKIRVGHFPIGIDFDSFENGARSDTVTQRVAAAARHFSWLSVDSGFGPARLQQGNSGTIALVSHRFGALSGTARPRGPDPGRRAEPGGDSQISRVQATHRSAGWRHQRPLLDQHLVAGAISLSVPRSRRSSRALSRVRHRLRNAAQRRNESRRKGILRVPYRRGWRAHPKPVRRRGRATQARRHARQSLRCRANGGHDFASVPDEPN